MAQGEPASVRVVRELAAAEGVDPEGLEPRLYDVVDPDALDALVESVADSDGSSVTVEFEYGGRSVTVDGAGRVRVTDPVVGSGR